MRSESWAALRVDSMAYLILFAMASASVVAQVFASDVAADNSRLVSVERHSGDVIMRREQPLAAIIEEAGVK